MTAPAVQKQPEVRHTRMSFSASATKEGARMYPHDFVLTWVKIPGAWIAVGWRDYGGDE